MLPRVGLVLLVGLALCSGLARASVPIIDPAAISTKTLDNGLKVIVKEAHSSPIVTLDLYVRSGSAVETELTSGAMHLLEHMIFQRRANGYGGRIAREIEGLGGEVYAETTRDFVHFRVTVAAEFFSRALDELALAVCDPQIDEGLLLREKRIVFAELRDYREQPLRVITEAGFALLFEGHPYALPVAGREREIARLDRDTLLRGVYEAHFTGPNMALVVVGDVSAEQVFKKAAQALSKLPDTPPPARSPAPPTPLSQERRRTIAGPGATTFLLLGFLAPSIAEKEAVCATDVLLGVVGEGSSSLLQREVAAKHKNVRACGAGFLTQRWPGMFYVWLQLAGGSVDNVEKDLRALLARLAKEGVSEEEVRRGRAIILGSYAMQCETFPDQAGALGFYEAIDTYHFAVEYEQRIRSVTKEQVDAVARRLFTQAPVVVVLAAEQGGAGQ